MAGEKFAGGYQQRGAARSTTKRREVQEAPRGDTILRGYG